MARIWASGFELNSTTSNVEWGTVSSGATIVTSNPHTGTYSGAITSLTSGTFKGFVYQFAAANTTGPFYYQFWIYINTAPNANTTIAGMQENSGAENLTVVLSTTRTLSLFTTDGATQIGSASSAVPLATWTCIELKMDNSPASGSMVGEMRVNKVVTATSSTLTTTNYPAGILGIYVGGNLEGESATTINIQFDDVALNNGSGSFDNTYPGGSSLLRYSPTGAGDSNTFGTQVGGTAGSANNFTRVNEVTPDNATSYNASITAASDLFAVGPVGGTLPAATINGVIVGGRVANLTGADTTASLQFQIEQTSGGTIQKSGAIIPDTLTWSTNSKAVPHNYPLSAPQDPTGTNWTATTISTMQIGYLIDTVHTDADAVSTIWAYVDYTPSSSVSASVTQTAATITLTGGTQGVVAITTAAVAQVGASVTLQGGTQLPQTAGTVNQVGANLVLTGGVQSAASIATSSITQVGAVLSLSGGTQAVAAKQVTAVSQSAANLTLTTGTQAVATTRIGAVAQSHATLTLTGGTQTVSASRISAVTQVGATLTLTGGTQSASLLTAAAVAQVGANLVITGGTQLVKVFIPPIWNYITLVVQSLYQTATGNDNSSANVSSTDTMETVSSTTNKSPVPGEDDDANVSSTSTNINIQG